MGGLGIDRPLRVRFSAGAGTLSPADARSALFSWLIARRSGGHFVVRLDDAQPLGEQASDAVTDLRWLGLEPDEGPDAGNAFGPYRSAERRALYDAALAELAARGATHERDGAMVLQRGVAATVVPDLLHGDVHFGGEALGEIVVRGADGVPSRVLRATVDDAAMRIDLVVQDGRGLDRAARQTALARALGVSSPRFAHAGTLVEPKDATLPAVGDLRRAGYLPGAVIEHLALLGWSPADGRETFTLEELAELFSLDRVGVSETHFDPDRLRAFNGRALRLLPRERYHALLAERMQRTRLLEDPIPAAAHRWIETFLDAFGAEAHTLGEAIDAVAALRAESTAIPALELERLRNRHVLFFLDTVSQYVDDQPELRDLPLGHDLPAIAAEFGLAREDAFAAVRMALTGTHDGPPLSLLFPLLGHERIMMRIGAVSSHILHGRGLDPIKFGPGGVPFETIRPELPQATANRGDGS
ncbi:MAG TPA: glutamate--tRNA ligase family protein [Candidatus Elarobacter sp.]|nr:glutamate--tRNA ligase family protein [Candidatus Elarobacter sp.]